MRDQFVSNINICMIKSLRRLKRFKSIVSSFEHHRCFHKHFSIAVFQYYRRFFTLIFPIYCIINYSMKAEQPACLEELEQLVNSAKGEVSIEFGVMSYQDHPLFLQSYNQRMEKPKAEFQKQSRDLSD